MELGFFARGNSNLNVFNEPKTFSYSASLRRNYLNVKRTQELDGSISSSVPNVISIFYESVWK